MSEIPQANSENVPSPDIKKDQEEAEALFYMIDRLSMFVESAPDPEPGIVKWLKMDVPLGKYHEAGDCNDNKIDGLGFEATLHEQDSAHVIWEFKFSNNLQGEDEKHVNGLAVKSQSGFELLLSPIEANNKQVEMAAYKKATPKQVATYYEETLYHLDSEVRIIAAGYDNIGYDSPDSPGQQEDWEHYLKFWAEEGITIPGLMENGHIIDKKA